MRRVFPALLLAVLLMTTACAGTVTGASTPQSTRSVSPTPIASASPTPTPLPTVVMPTPETTPPPTPEPVFQPEKTYGPNEVNPADYVSYAVDTVNGGIPLTGVSFTTTDGRTICGIFSAGHLSTPPGAVACTIDSFRDVFPQLYPDTGPYVQSVMADPVTGSSYGLYPDWFAQPARTIPVLADGKTLRYENTACTVSGESVTCIVSSTGPGFTVSPTAYNLF